jgi:hypothetical protein
MLTIPTTTTTITISTKPSYLRGRKGSLSSWEREFARKKRKTIFELNEMAAFSKRELR